MGVDRSPGELAFSLSVRDLLLECDGLDLVCLVVSLGLEVSSLSGLEVGQVISRLLGVLGLSHSLVVALLCKLLLKSLVVFTLSCHLSISFSSLFLHSGGGLLMEIIIVFLKNSSALRLCLLTLPSKHGKIFIG